MEKQIIIKRIIKDCFWEYNISEHDILDILKSKDKRLLLKLFSKIIYNSNNKLYALRLFEKSDLKQLFDDFKITYNKKYIEKHVMVLRNILLGEKNVIKSLEWKKL